MAKKELSFIFENPNSPGVTEEILKKILLEKLLSLDPMTAHRCTDRLDE